MTSWPQLSSWRRAFARTSWRDEQAAQIVEFAVALPLLVLFVVGIFDFSAAYTLKQKLTNLARETARVAAADPANDLGNPLPASISDAFWVVDNYLVANHINDCGITISGVTPTGLIWTFSKANNGCTGTGLVVTVNRGYYFPAATTVVPADLNCTPQAVNSNQVAVISTCVSIQYAYQWRFGRAIALLGSTISLPTTITATAVAMNEN